MLQGLCEMDFDARASVIGLASMTDELTKNEIARRAQELARRVMAKPPAPRVKPKPTKASDASAKPRKRGPTASAS